jgi:SAM-dependent methyltransferase
LTSLASISGVVCFRRRLHGADEDRLEQLNRSLAEALAASGQGLVSSTRLRGRFALRMCVLNHTSGTLDVERVLDWFERDPLPPAAAEPPTLPLTYDRDPPIARQGRCAVHRMGHMTPDDPWLAAVWPFVRAELPPTPASVLEMGCGSLGGFVPALLDAGYQAVGVDPEAPDGPEYQRVEIEHYEPLHPVDCVVASLSLHHVAELDMALDQLQALLVPGGALVVVEWAWERFDQATAQWSFARLASPEPGAEPGWLHRHQERWAASGKLWDGYLRDWATEEGLHPGGAILRGLDARFDRRFHAESPYFFAELADTSEAEEQAAIDAGRIRAGGIRYAATRP